MREAAAWVSAPTVGAGTRHGDAIDRHKGLTALGLVGGKMLVSGGAVCQAKTLACIGVALRHRDSGQKDAETRRAWEEEKAEKRKSRERHIKERQAKAKVKERPPNSIRVRVEVNESASVAGVNPRAVLTES